MRTMHLYALFYVYVGLSPAQGITAKREIWFWSSGQEEKAFKKECRNPGLLPMALRKAVHFGRRMFRLPKLGSLNPLVRCGEF